MEELRQEFLAEATENLKNLQAKLQAETFSEDFQREIFRNLHTLKGTAHTFGFGEIGTLAHRIENVLHAVRSEQQSSEENPASILRQGLAHLSEMMQKARAGEKTSLPTEFVEKIGRIKPQATAPRDSPYNLSPEIESQLSAAEKNQIDEAVRSGKELFIIEIGFSFENFADKFKDFRSILDAAGKVVAAFPSPKFAAEGKMGFRFFFITEKSFAGISKMIEPLNGEIIYKLSSSAASFVDNSTEFLWQPIEGAKNLAAELGKEISFEVSFDETGISLHHVKVFFTALLHLTRNAVDHGIENKGVIEIKLAADGAGLRLTVSDDGHGIDHEKIRERAIAQKLISPEDNLTGEELLRLIFAYGFSTRDTVSEISGRGVGLDAVEAEVKRVGGEIRVQSEPGKGTTFEIYVPYEI